MGGASCATPASARFGDSADERLLRAILERAYLDPAGGHARGAAI